MMDDGHGWLCHDGVIQIPIITGMRRFNTVGNDPPPEVGAFRRWPLKGAFPLRATHPTIVLYGRIEMPSRSHTIVFLDVFPSQHIHGERTKIYTHDPQTLVSPLV